MVEKRRLGQRWAGYQATKATLFWSCAACVVATVVVGFTWGGWVTGGTARSMAAAAGAGGRDEIVAAICVDRFQAGRDAHGQLAALKELQSWSRGSFIEKGGWAVMPDRAKPTGTATRLCADRLAAL
jgi:hypothetical protein